MSIPETVRRTERRAWFIPLAVRPACRTHRIRYLAISLVLLAGWAMQGCGSAESRNTAVVEVGADDDRPEFTLVAQTEADSLNTYAVDARDSLAIFGRGRDVVVVNVADPSQPRVVGSITLAGEVRDLALRGRHAFAAADSAGVHIIDLSEPATPYVIGRMRFADRAYGVDAADGRAYVAARSEGLRILDVSNPAAPTEIGRLLTSDEAVDVVLRGDYAYVAAWYAGMRVIDVGDPLAPEEVSFASFDSYDNGAAWSVHVDGDIAVQAVPDMGLRTVDVSDPHNVKLYKVYRGLFAPTGAAVRGRTAFVADQDAGFRVLDLADPVAPAEIGVLDLPGSAMSVTLSEDIAYVAAREAGLRIIDISRPNDPREIAHVDASDEAVDLVLAGDTLVAAGSQNGVTLYGSAPRLRTLTYVAGPSNRVAIHGSSLLVGGENQISIYRRSDLTAPPATASISGAVHGLAANDEIVVAAAERFGIRLLERGSLRELGSFEPDRALLASSNQVQMLRTPVAAWDVLLDGDRVIGAFDDGIRVIDISTPSRPTLHRIIPSSQRVYRLALRGSQLFAACDDGLRVINLSEPSDPAERAYLKTPSFATALAMDGDRLYVGDLSGVITVVSMSEPHERIAEVKVADRVLSLAIMENGLAVAAGGQGVRIVSDLATSTVVD